MSPEESAGLLDGPLQDGLFTCGFATGLHDIVSLKDLDTVLSVSRSVQIHDAVFC